MKRKEKIILSVIGVIIVIFALVGITYAYFLTQISGNTNTKSIEVTTADLKLVYEDGNGIISATNIIPGTTISTKTFNVTNTGNDLIENYVIYLEDVVNNLYYREDLVYSITCNNIDKNNNIVSNCNGITNELFPRDNTIAVLNNIEPNIKQSYTLTLNYKETGLDQSRDMKKNIKAKINIYDRREKISYLTDNNNVSNFIDNINELEKHSKNYLQDTYSDTSNYNKSKAKWLVFNSISKLKYDSENWTIVAGPKDASFSSYLTTNNFNINNLNSNYTADDSKNTSEIVHFSAPLAANIYKSNSVMKEVHFDDLAGWAGDLQSFILNNVLPNVSDTTNETEVYNKTLELIGKSNTYFSLDDLYADIDAVNIYNLIDNTISLDTTLNNYYHTQYKDRFYLFVNNLIDTYNYETLQNKIAVYTVYKYPYLSMMNIDMAWPLYKSEIPTSVSNGVKRAFTDYIWYKTNSKSLDIMSENNEYKKNSYIKLYAEYVTKENKLDKSLTNTDYNWSVTNESDNNCSSTIDSDGILHISSSETNTKLKIKIILKKSNLVVGEKIININ